MLRPVEVTNNGQSFLFSFIKCLVWPSVEVEVVEKTRKATTARKNRPHPPVWFTKGARSKRTWEKLKQRLRKAEREGDEAKVDLLWDDHFYYAKQAAIRLYAQLLEREREDTARFQQQQEFSYWPETTHQDVHPPLPLEEADQIAVTQLAADQVATKQQEEDSEVEDAISIFASEHSEEEEDLSQYSEEEIRELFRQSLQRMLALDKKTHLPRRRL